MKKAFDQTVRDLKREVNKKVLKVPGIEQKILDATSNEPWGPHGSHLADIAQATRNYHDYEIIMHVIWKRLNDTGKNWRHVYKGLTVLEYLVGHGSERVIDDIREHAYQISTLSNFQYIDSSAKDQGSNVRRKSQSLVALVNDKERIQEVRQKALANKDKYRSAYSTGGRSPYSGVGSYGDRYDDDRYEGRPRDSYEGRYRDEDRNGYGRERDWSSRDDEKYGRGGDSYNRDGDRYGRDSDERYGRDSYRDDEHRGRDNEDYQFGPRNRSFDRDRERSSEEEDHYPSRNSGGRVDEPSQDERRFERKVSEQSPPLSYEAAVKDTHDHVQDGRGVGNVPPSGTISDSLSAVKSSSPANTSQDPRPPTDAEFDEFDPRGSIPATQAPASSAGVDFFGNQSASDPIGSLALVPVSFTSAESDAPTNSDVGTNFVPLSSASAAFSQPSEDLFGDGQFKASTQEIPQSQQQNSTPAISFQPSSGTVQGAELLAAAAPKMETSLTFDFGDTLGGLTYNPAVANGHQNFDATPLSMASEFPVTQGINSDVLGSAPPSGSAVFTPEHAYQQPATSTNLHMTNVNNLQQSGSSAVLTPQPVLQAVSASNSQTALTVPAQPGNAQPTKDKFETKSKVWTDTLNRGLVNLNISGAKVNPLANIGVDFDAINRMDKRKEKSSAAPVTSTITMGKAMGSGSGIGRAGAGSFAPPRNSMMGPGMGAAGAVGVNVGMGGYAGGMNQSMGMNMGMGMNRGMGMGMGMNMGMNQGAQMRPPMQGHGMPGLGYNPMMGTSMGGYGTQPYGAGYR